MNWERIELESSHYWRLVRYFSRIHHYSKRSKDFYLENGIISLINKIFSFLLIRISRFISRKKNKYLFKRKDVVFITGCPEDTMRYRCYHHQEQLGLFGVTSDVFEFDKIDWYSITNYYKIFILHRVSYTPVIAKAITTGKKNNKIFIFETDDLIFNEAYLPDITFLKEFPQSFINLYADSLVKYNRTLMLCNYAICSTIKLKNELAKFIDPGHVFINKNCVNDTMISISKEALENNHKSDNLIRIGYMSGTNTHNYDFREVQPALLSLLKKYSNLMLHIAGPLEISDEFKPFSQQIIRIPFMNWKKLPFEIAKLDINLAPLENTAFSQAKSDLKYFEAALVKVPTVASYVDEYIYNIRDGYNGFLAKNKLEWEEKLENLIKDKNLRLTIGENAYNEIIEKRNLTVTAENFNKIINSITEIHNTNRAKPEKTLNWILQAPFKGSGGYTSIFRMAGLLVDLGYCINFYIEKIGHFRHKSDEFIIDYLYNHFNVGKINLFIGHKNFADAGITFATGWPTAYVVNKIKNTNVKVYFVQDYEAEFYPEDSKEYALAKGTYSLGLPAITLGSYLAGRLKKDHGMETSYIDFAAERSLFFQKPAARSNKIRIIFYARPSTKRRGFETGREALGKVWKKHGDQIEIALFGADDLEKHNIPFPYINLGILSEKQLAREFACSDIGISFSLSNISLVPLEMMSCQCAVLEIRSESSEGILSDNDNCLLAAFDSNEIAVKINFLIENPLKRKKISLSGLEYAEKFSWENSAKKMDSIIHQLYYQDTRVNI
jgi:glycosyltransferase involved in cell wall biosynthesis